MRLSSWAIRCCCCFTNARNSASSRRMSSLGFPGSPADTTDTVGGSDPAGVVTATEEAPEAAAAAISFFTCLRLTASVPLPRPQRT
jgi:hypothetical protein